MPIKPSAHKLQHSIQAPHQVLIMQDRHLHRISEQPRLAQISEGHLVQPPALAAAPMAGCPGACQISIWRSPRQRESTTCLEICSSHPHGKEVFSLDTQRESSVFQFVHVTSCPGYRHWQELSSIFLAPSLQALIFRIFFFNIYSELLMGRLPLLEGFILLCSWTLPWFQ